MSFKAQRAWFFVQYRQNCLLLHLIIASKVDIILLRSDYSRPVYFACSVKFHTKQDHHEGNDVTVSQQYVIFKLNDKYFGVNIAHVMEIIWPQKVFKVPDTPPYVEGLINVRGKVFALLNLKEKFRLPDTKVMDEEAKMIIVMINSKTLAFMVDVVEEIISIEDEEIVAVSDSSLSHCKKYLKGTAKFGDRSILLIDFEPILNETQK